MKKIVVCLMAMAFFSFAGCSSWRDSDAKAAALAAANTWLLLIDAERYDESWKNSSRLFQTAVPKEKWLQAMEAAKIPLGKNLSWFYKALFCFSWKRGSYGCS